MYFSSKNIGSSVTPILSAAHMKALLLRIVRLMRPTIGTMENQMAKKQDNDMENMVTWRSYRNSEVTIERIYAERHGYSN